MTVSEARLVLSALPPSLEIVLSFGSPMYKRVAGFALRDANLFSDDSLWRKTHYIHIKDGKEVDHDLVKVIEIEFTQERTSR